ncbi:MAG: hypothetical protein LBC07_03090 [Elusimicrobiota bacterium]|nr:hypothetical protein [Elusimicrobiota bacterium]
MSCADKSKENKGEQDNNKSNANLEINQSAQLNLENNIDELDPQNRDDYWDKLKEFYNTSEYINVNPELIPIFIVDDSVYEIDKDMHTIYKRGEGGKKIKIAYSKEVFSAQADNRETNYSIYKNQKEIYILSFFTSDAASYNRLFAINETSGQLYEITVNEIFGYYNYTYIDEGQVYVCFFNELSNRLETVNITPSGVGNGVSRNIVIAKEKDSPANEELVIKSYDKDRVKFFFEATNEIKYEDKKTGKIYTKKQVLMYTHYLHLKTLMRVFGKTGVDPFGAFDLMYEVTPYSDEEWHKIHTGENPTDLKILSIEEFTENIR